MRSNQKWIIRRPPNPEARADLSDFSPIEQALLLARGITKDESAKAFLTADHPEFHDSFLMGGVDKSVELILKTMEDGGKICVYADYDADGITAAALLYGLFEECQIDTIVYFPDRFKEGYGLNVGAIEKLASQDIALLITVDCGIRGRAEVDKAVELGMDVIVTDHHVPGDMLPKAASIVNPNQPGDAYPFKGLAGVGVAYKLAQAVASQFNLSSSVETGLDLVAIGTVADMVPLVDENRHMVQRGIQFINESPRPGVEALIHVSGIQPGSINSGTIGYSIAPRINAAGRLAAARQAFDLLIEKDLERANALSERLDRLNKERQNLTNEVMKKIAGNPPSASDKVIFSFDHEYHQGVVGLAASRITERYYRPSIVGTIGETNTTASARSIAGFDITGALEDVSDLLSRYGGHRAAAGFTIENSKREKFIDRLIRVVDSRISMDMLIPMLSIDACIGLDMADSALMLFLDKLEPYGNANNQPVFCATDVRVLAKRVVGRDSSHLKLTLEGAGRPFDAIAFRMGDRISTLPELVDIAFNIERNHYLGYETLQLRIVDIRPAGSLDDEELTEWVEVD